MIQLPNRPKHGQKGLFGRVLVLGGCESMPGAPALAGIAALVCGAGLVQIATPEKNLQTTLSFCPELIGLPLQNKPNLTPLLEAAEKADALVIGPGLGTSTLAKQRVMALLRLKKPAVIDADALNILAFAKQTQIHLAAVLTPHPGEMVRLVKHFCPGIKSIPTEIAKRTQLAKQAALFFKQTLLLKGYPTIVTDSVRIFKNKTGDSSLSKAGTGDVLSGVIGCLLAQGMDPFEAGSLGAWIHGKAGELAGQALTRRCPLAQDVIGMIPCVLSKTLPVI